MDAYLFHQGTNYLTYNYLGSHYVNEKREQIVFRVWAPNASEIFLTGDFNNWTLDTHPMKMITDKGVWEIVCDSELFDNKLNYKYRVVNINKNSDHLKADPYAFYSETLKKTASKFYDISGFEWTDEGWMNYRKKTYDINNEKKYSCPINIYELHLGSWRTRDGATTFKNENAYLSYNDIADRLIPYIKEMGYTHVELMPVMEHPYDGSWGYQVCGYYAPTSRYGKPQDFMNFINRLHNAGIGVILDWVPAHFPKDEHGLYEFDGGLLYEYQGSDRMEHYGWGTRCFDVGRTEVQSFLISNAVYWLNEYHIDGLRIDAVASMLYLDYDRNNGEWVPNTYGDNRNLEAIAFFQKLNTELINKFSDVMLIAEESTSWDKITSPVSDNGLGFTLKWNMGWANDMFAYVIENPLYRKNHHTKLTFSMMYSMEERYVLPVSHDEVVHGKLSLLDKMYGDYEMKFAGFRTFMCHMMAHPGKKLLFMGSEYAPFREWDYENQLEWFMLDYEMHKKTQRFTADLNHLYLKTKPLWEDDFSWNGFNWINADDKDNNVLVYERKSSDGNSVIAVMNFSNAEIKNYMIYTGQRTGQYKIIMNTDNVLYGGNDIYGNNLQSIDDYIYVNLAPLSALYINYKCEENEGGCL